MTFRRTFSTAIAAFSLVSVFSIHANQNHDALVQELWTKHVTNAQKLTERKTNHDNKAIKFSDKTMKFSMDKIGVPGKNGYPLYIALHGGGSTSQGMNDSQWEHMKVYYKDSVENGVYVATRGITNNWNLHFEEESYPLYEQLIENMVLFEGVDPNRVYLLGFSAGGDGVYQVIPRMADRFAAANMSAGHHNWIPFDNIRNTPFLIQVGENDSAFERNKVAAKNYLEIKELNKKYDGGYTTDVFVHTNFYHNGWPDNDARRPQATVIANPAGWLNTQDRSDKTVNSNAIDWVNQYERNATPQKIVWDLNTDASLRTESAGATVLSDVLNEPVVTAKPHELFYWLDVSVADQYPKDGKLVVEYVRENNTVNVLEATNVDKFRVLLNESMVINFDTPVAVMMNHELVDKVTLRPRIDTMTRTLLERSDKNYAFDTEFTLERDASGNWKVLK